MYENLSECYVNSEVIGKRIGHLLDLMKIDNLWLASKLGITRQSIYKWRNGEALPDMQNLVYLSEILNVSIDYIIKGKVMSVNDRCAAYFCDETENSLRDVGVDYVVYGEDDGKNLVEVKYRLPDVRYPIETRKNTRAMCNARFFKYTLLLSANSPA
jgi:transcriptional regulator with XRE-family HTH domain